jgi:hypothetical protein
MNAPPRLRFVADPIVHLFRDALTTRLAMINDEFVLHLPGRSIEMCIYIERDAVCVDLTRRVSERANEVINCHPFPLSRGKVPSELLKFLADFVTR